MSWTWQGRQLVTAEKDGTTLNYTYDSEGIRTSKSDGTNTTKYLLNGTQILAQKTGSTILSFFYDQQGNRVGMADGSNNFYYYLYNIQGDVVALADASTGKLAATYTYDAWGKCTVTNASGYTIGTQNPFRYKGYYYDTETGLYYLNSRYYDAETGRFINADAFASTDISGPLSANMFAYCENRPIIGSDPDRKWVNLVIGAAIGIGTQFVEDISVAMITGAPLDSNFSSIGTYAAAAFSGAISSIPGGGLLKASVDIIGSSYIQECVDIIAYNDESRDYNKNILKNATTKSVSLKLESSAESIAKNIGSKYKGNSRLIKRCIKTTKSIVYTACKHASSIINVFSKVFR